MQNKINYPKWTEEEDKIILENYIKVKHRKDLKQFFPNRTLSAVIKRFKTLKLRKSIDIYKNEDFFKSPNLINSYWAGMISTDGWINCPSDRYSNYRLQLALKWSDKEHLEKFKRDIQSNSNILYSKVSRNFYNVGPNRKDEIITVEMGTFCLAPAQSLVMDLNKHWNIPLKNKTYDMIEPNITDINLGLAYIKGMIDGDGSILMTDCYQLLISGEKKTIPLLRIMFLGTERLLIWIRDFLSQILSAKQIKRKIIQKPHAKVYGLNINGVDAIILFDILKNLNCPQLDRKWNRSNILQFVEEQKLKYPDLYKISQEKLKNLRDSQNIISHSPILV